MDPVKLEMFVTAKDCGSIYKAAMLLKRSPSDILGAIETLEKETGAKLFFQNDTCFNLSCEGQMLYLHALEVLDSWYIAEGIINRLVENSKV